MLSPIGDLGAEPGQPTLAKREVVTIPGRAFPAVMKIFPALVLRLIAPFAVVAAPK